MSLQNNSWSITPLGGVGEIGSNMTMITLPDTQIIIDIGILFPYEDFFDINYLIPDFSKVDSEKKTILVITHGHEDHIGAIHHLVGHLSNYTVFAPRFAKELIHKKLQKNNAACTINLYDEKTLLDFGTIKIKPIQVNHSIPDTYGLILHDKKTAMIYISDFKVDPKAFHEPVIDLKFIQEYLKNFDRKLCLLDSTNILQSQKTSSETDLVPAFKKIIASESRIFITLFSSNIHRIKNIIAVAKEHGKKIVISGRSLWFYIEAAKAVNIITEDEFSQLIDYNSQIPNKYIVLLTGCQGEHFGSLRRVAIGEHPIFKLNENDTVVFSSKNIPGNEKKIGRIINNISSKGANIITAYDELIHASGHPAQEDLKLLIDSIDPTHYVPIHGETFFLKKHLELIKKISPKTQSFFVQNGDTINIDNEISITKNAALPPVIIHGANIQIEREKISERRKMACNGTVFVTLSTKKNEIIITFKGLPSQVEEQKEDLMNLISTLSAKNRKKDINDISEEIRIGARNFLKISLGYKPITIVHAV